MTTDLVRAESRRPAGWVLVVDDSEDVREAVAEYLATSGYRTQAADGAGALGLLEASTVPPRLVLLDWMMPGVSGSDVLDRLRAEPKTVDVPVVILTAMAAWAVRDLGRLPGNAVRIVRKPVTGKRLLSVVDEMASRSAEARA